MRPLLTPLFPPLAFAFCKNSKKEVSYRSSKNGRSSFPLHSPSQTDLHHFPFSRWFAQFKDWRKIQNSKTKRFFVRASHGGKKDALEARAEKEEREYIEAFEAERTQKDAVEMLEREVNEEQAVVGCLLVLCGRACEC